MNINSSSSLSSSLSSSSSLPLRPNTIGDSTTTTNTTIPLTNTNTTTTINQHNDFHIDESILHNDDNPQPPHMSPMIKSHSHRDSTDISFNTSPESAWNAFNFNTPVTTSMNTSAATTTTFLHRNAPSCLDLNTSQSMGHSNYPPWSMSGSSDTFSPTTTGGEHIPDYGNPFSQSYQLGSVLVSPGPLQHTSFPTSPPFSPSSSDQDGRRNSGLGRPQSPSFSVSANLLRRDGIRKKNARFDIPAERNLKTIDQLIQTTTDESELKELKQQKRLLRNRQAALDSRQRKKQHTERLEEEKKHFTAIINDLEDTIAEYKAREADQIRQREAWTTSQQQIHEMQVYINSLHMQHEEVVRQHTNETGELRRKNAMLMEQCHRLESTAMSNAPSSHGISNEYNEFDQINLGPWDHNLEMSHDFSIENTEAPVQQGQQPPSSKSIQEAEKPAASALLLMLLLCGAWVASGNNSSDANVLPAIPDDMRTASANILTNLYQDSGVQLDGISLSTKAINTNTQKTVLSVIESAGFSSNLDDLHQRLTTPNAQQLKDQAFGLSSSQYYDLLSGDAQYQQAYHDHHRSSKLVGDPVLQEPSTMAENYTRSLLRDKVSTQVLKDFARMVAQSNIKSPHTWKNEPM